MAKTKRALPGFRLSLGFTLTYMTVMVVIPLAACILTASRLSWDQFQNAVTNAQAISAYRVCFTTSLVAAILNGVFGLFIAWVLVRYPFPGRSILDALVDFPLALPTAVAGITFGSLYAGNGWFGQYLGFLEPEGFVGHWFSSDGWFGSHLFAVDVRAHDGPLAIILVLVFVSLPFVIRAVQPVLAEFEAEQEEAAANLGANRWQTFRYVILPAIVPAWLTGFTLAYARGLGEYGSVIFVASNIPFETEIPPLLIIAKLEQFKYEEAAAIAVVMLGFSLFTLLVINLLERWSRRHQPVV